VNVSNNIITLNNSQKYDITNKTNKREEFKKSLESHELRLKDSSNKRYNEDQNLDKSNKEYNADDIEKIMIKDNTPEDLENDETENKLKEEVTSIIKGLIEELKQSTEELSEQPLGEDKYTEQIEQINQLLQFLSSMFQNTEEITKTESGEGQLNSINLEQLMNQQQLMNGDKLTPETKTMLKNNLSEIVELLEKSKGNVQITSQTINALQKLTTEVATVKGNLGLLEDTTILTGSENNESKTIKDNLLKKVVEQSNKTISEIVTKDQMQNPNDPNKDNKFSKNNSSEDKFLKTLIASDKDESKISKAVNFMNQFESVKTTDTSKVQIENLTIDKNSVTVDVIKSIKFMEVNNMKNLTVKMDPKELGEITIKLTVESGILKAVISAQNKDTYNLLNQNIQDITDRLKNMDIKIQSLDINIYEDSTFFNKEFNKKNNNQKQTNDLKTNLVLEEEEDVIIKDNYSIERSTVNKFV
jgi:flagellar hook-length control protein FliK